jgi:6-phosphogluconolactonase (cycloisomerase 2 family)
MSSEQDLQIDATGKWLLALNNDSNDVTVFAIEADGSLVMAPGSPFATGATPMKIAVHPTLPAFYVSHAGDNTIGTFRIGPDGSLSSIQVTTVPGFSRDLAVEAQGRFLYVADMSNGVQGYGIADDGSLTHLPGSPYSFASSRPYEIEIDSRSSRVLVLDLDNGLASFSIGESGALTLVPGSPVPVGGFSHTLAVSGDDRFAYVGFPVDGRILAYGLTPAGLPALLDPSPLTSFPSLNQLHVPAGTNQLYATTREARTVQAFSIAQDGALVLNEGSSLTVEDPESRVPNGVVWGRRSSSGRFRRGDANADGAVDLADALFTLNHLFRGGETPVCPDAADADDSEGLDLGDPIFLLNHLFRGGARIHAPGSDACGVDPTADGLADCGYPPDLCTP